MECRTDHHCSPVDVNQSQLWLTSIGPLEWIDAYIYLIYLREAWPIVACFARLTRFSIADVTCFEGDWRREMGKLWTFPCPYRMNNVTILKVCIVCVVCTMRFHIAITVVLGNLYFINPEPTADNGAPITGASNWLLIKKKTKIVPEIFGMRLVIWCDALTWRAAAASDAGRRVVTRNTRIAWISGMTCVLCWFFASSTILN